MSAGPRAIKVRFDGTVITIVNPQAQTFHRGGKALKWIRDPSSSTWTFSSLEVGDPIPPVTPNPISGVQVGARQITASNNNPGGVLRVIPYKICVKSPGGKVVCQGATLGGPTDEPPFQIENEPNGGVDDPDARPPKGRPGH
jgi:hypothetical protein